MKEARRGATLLGVEVGEQRAFLRQSVNVGRFVAHHAEVVRTDIVDADVAPDDEDVRLLAGLLRLCGSANIIPRQPELSQWWPMSQRPGVLLRAASYPFSSCQRCPDCLLSVVIRASAQR